MNVFDLDLHVHAVSELWGTPREDFFDALKRLDIKLAGLLDHAEFYFDSPSPWIVNSIQRMAEQGIDIRPSIARGIEGFCQDLRAYREAGGHDFLIGLEVAQLDSLPDSDLEHPDYISHCFGISAEEDVERGAMAAERIRIFGDKIRACGKPGILNHAFRPLVYKAREAGLAGEPIAHESLISRDDIQRVCDATMQAGLFLEFNTGTIRAVEDSPEALDFFVYVLNAVEELGPDMSVGSDSHQPTLPITDGIRSVVEGAGLSDARFDVLVGRMEALRNAL